MATVIRQSLEKTVSILRGETIWKKLRKGLEGTYKLLDGKDIIRQPEEGDEKDSERKNGARGETERNGKGKEGEVTRTEKSEPSEVENVVRNKERESGWKGAGEAREQLDAGGKRDCQNLEPSNGRPWESPPGLPPFLRVDTRMAKHVGKKTEVCMAHVHDDCIGSRKRG